MCIDAPDAGIDFYTTFYLRMVDLHTVLVMEGYDVSFVAVQEAMTDNNYNDKFKRVWTQWKNERGFLIKRRVLTELGVKVKWARGSKIHVDLDDKMALWHDFKPRRRFGQLVSTWGSAKPPPGVHSGQPFANKIFFQAAFDAFQQWAVAGKLCLKAYHIAWIIMVVDYGLTRRRHTTMGLSNSHPKNKAWITDLHKRVRQVVIDHFSNYPKEYSKDMRGWKWGEYGLYVHESGFKDEWQEPGREGKGKAPKGGEGEAKD
ncbi:hypothetical protein CLOP_g16182 [Closterium sp. NIES-67]|nr:hypothetical protein CLOP_g7659 [Closterium sp. NIES-67]GJP61113.1 hypothetical protein CLOP_g18317 [Closterium sp. NIES-67]GJP65143.1 hypothetical protein CLOP_g22048 [Closterium sp. NIES-67]GJP86116.1 hypothetical protein CLOP_g16182 [Closterium sp. NIES-67]